MITEENPTCGEELVEDEVCKKDHLGLAIVGAVAGSALSIFLYVWIASSIGATIGYMLWGVGVIVGVLVRWLGRGTRPIFGIIAAVSACASCLIADLWVRTIDGFTAIFTVLSVFEAYKLGVGTVIDPDSLLN